MPNKQEVISSLIKDNYSKAEVVHLIEGTKLHLPSPKFLKKGDIYTDSMGGGKRRPIVIIAVNTEIVFGIALSCTPTVLTMSIKATDRFLDRECSFTYGIICTQYDVALYRFCGIFENTRALNKAIKLNKQFIIDNI